MGEIHEFPFGKRGSEKAAETAPNPSEHSTAEGDWLWAKSNLERFKEALQVSGSVSAFAESLPPGWFNPHQLALRREALKETTLEELCNLLLISRESDWKAHPHNYLAVVSAFDDRRAAVLRLKGAEKNEE